MESVAEKIDKLFNPPKIQMNPEVKDKWLKKLRNPLVMQDTGSLRTDHGYCCLGVLCEVYSEEHPEEQWNESRPGVFTFMSNPNYLPREVRTWAGLPSSLGARLLTENGDKVTLPSLNDSGMRFKDIADLIEKQL